MTRKPAFAHRCDVRRSDAGNGGRRAESDKRPVQLRMPAARAFERRLHSVFLPMRFLYRLMSLDTDAMISDAASMI